MAPMICTPIPGVKGHCTQCAAVNFISALPTWSHPPASLSPQRQSLRSATALPLGCDFTLVAARIPGSAGLPCGSGCGTHHLVARLDSLPLKLSIQRVPWTTRMLMPELAPSHMFSKVPLCKELPLFHPWLLNLLHFVKLSTQKKTEVKCLQK